jgi:hypothetical protein
MDQLRKLIRESFEIAEQMLGEMDGVIEDVILDEERMTNKQAAELVSKRENFVGSHTYGEDLGDKGLMYVAYSYGEQHPLYLWYEDTWYYNYDDYINDDGSVNKWTKKHLEDLRPNTKTQGRPKSFLQKLITQFKDAHGLGDNSHTDLEPGEK